MTLRNCRSLVVLAALALSGCPFNFKFNVENGAGEAVALRPEGGDLAVAAAGTQAPPRPAPPQGDSGP